MARSSLAIGVTLAAIAAAAFGATTPFVAYAGRELGPFATAALLYAGAAGAAAVLRAISGRSDNPLRRSDAGRLIAVALVGASLAPTLLAWGLQRAGAITGALLLNLEAVFTVLLAHLVFREHVGSRVLAAVTCMAVGGCALAIDVTTSAGGTFGLLGALAVAGATLAWATDNALTRPLAERDPWEVILAKGGIGAVVTGVAAVIRGEPMPSLTAAAILLACGATGYGASLRLYLSAQRRIGAARTGSVFALAPFVGASLAWILGDRVVGWGALVAVGLFAVGVYLHASERHAHAHAHARADHEHAHTHDDGHHDHVHDPPVVGEHTHVHHHELLEHEHDHASDLHHDHH